MARCTCGKQGFCDKCLDDRSPPKKENPPIDISRFHKGPMTPEQCDQYNGKWLLAVIGKHYFTVFPFKSELQDGYLLDDGSENDQFKPDEVELWYPLP